ncbi:substrate import-associated zinc metallohydrolase lipoprotein [Ancylomarina sp. YFZ004]
MKLYRKIIFLLVASLGLFAACDNDDELNYEKVVVEDSTDEIDVYLKEHFLDKYNCAIRWRWDDKFISVDYYVSPPLRDVVISAAKMIEHFWVEPFVESSAGGKAFIENNFPPEIVLIGSEILNENGTETLGFAEAGVRITLTEMNQYDLTNKTWLTTQLHTMHHEFTHIVHQTYKLPEGFETYSGSKYTGNSWTTITEDNAISRGVTTPYGTTNEFEDFAELVSNFIILDKEIFDEKYAVKSEAEISDEVNKLYDYIMTEVHQTVIDTRAAAETEARDAGKTEAEIKTAGDIAVRNLAVRSISGARKTLEDLNVGKELIKEKLNITKDYYTNKFDVNLEKLRDLVQERITNAQKKED